MQNSTETATETRSSLAPTVAAQKFRCPAKRLRVYRVVATIGYDGDGSNGEVRVQFQGRNYWPRADSCSTDCPGGGPVTFGCSGRDFICVIRSTADVIDLNNARTIDLLADDQFKSLRVGLVEGDSGGAFDPDDTYAAYAASAPASDWYDETCTDYDVIVSRHRGGGARAALLFPRRNRPKLRMALLLTQGMAAAPHINCPQVDYPGIYLFRP